MLARAGAIHPAVQRLLLLVGCALLFGVWFWRVPLLEVDETRYTAASRTMLESGDYIIPYYNGQPRYQKPILFYWIQSTSMRLFGENEIAARLPAAMAGVLMVLLVHAFLLRWLPARAPNERARREARGAAFLGAAMLATLPLFAVWARGAVTDVILTFFFTLALFGVLQADLARRTATDDTARRLASRWYLLTAVGAGLAFLTKGPIAVLVPVLVWLAYHLRQRTLGTEWRRVPWLAVILLFLAISVPWYAATYVRDGGAFLHRFFLTENVERFAGAQDGVIAKTQANVVQELTSRAGNLAAFLLALLAAHFPYGAFLLHELFGRHRGAPVLEDEVPAAMRRFAWTWVAVSVGFIALSKTQYPNYVQNIAAAVTILFVLYLLELRRWPAETEPVRERVGALPVTILLVLAPVLTAFMAVLGLRDRPELGKYRAAPWTLPDPPFALPLSIVVGVLGLALCIGIIVLTARRRPLGLVGWTMGVWAVLCVLLLWGVFPLHVTGLHGAAMVAGRDLRGRYPGLTAVTFTHEPPEDMIYYARRPMVLINSRSRHALDELSAALRRHGEIVLITGPEHLPAIEALGTVQVEKRYTYYVVARVRAGR